MIYIDINYLTFLKDFVNIQITSVRALAQAQIKKSSIDMP